MMLGIGYFDSFATRCASSSSDKPTSKTNLSKPISQNQSPKTKLQNPNSQIYNFISAVYGVADLIFGRQYGLRYLSAPAFSEASSRMER